MTTGALKVPKATTGATGPAGTLTAQARAPSPTSGSSDRLVNSLFSPGSTGDVIGGATALPAARTFLALTGDVTTPGALSRHHHRGRCRQLCQDGEPAAVALASDIWSAVAAKGKLVSVGEQCGP